jgi:tripartite-type tricarboxylate transporter receptor subunit TctC
VLYTKMPYQGERDFTPISLFPSGALIMGVPSSLGVKDVREFVEMSRNKPAAYGTYGAGSWPHMVINDLNERASAKLTPVHYRGETPMWVDASTGQVQAAMGSFLGINNYLGKGSIRAIAAIGNLRCPKLPQLPTFIEQGFSAPVYGLEGWIPFVAPAATPQDIVVKMAEAIQEASETPRMAAIRDAFAIPNKPTALEESRKRWKEESAVWIDIAGKLGIKLD